MKKIIITVAAVLTAFSLFASTSFGIAQHEGTVELSSKSCPALDCKLALSSAKNIFVLLPDNIKTICRSEYARISRECRFSDNYKYQGVNIRTTGKDGVVNIEFTYAGYSLKVTGTTWEQLDQMFA